MLYHEDCLNILKTMSDESVDMVYLDPPFYTQKKQVLFSADGKRYEFSDIWDSRSAYLEYMRVRLTEMKRVLKPVGTIFLHCDSSASHYLRLLMDDIFGEKHFQSEIIWSYRRWSNSGKRLLPAHQTIFFYSKTSQYKFHTLYREYSPATNVDQILQERTRGRDGKAVYKRDANGDTVPAGEKKGVPLSDVWEIPFLNPRAKERTGYPTQKPVELLDRIIKISTDEGDCILDPFCGSGTTLVSARLLGRNFIGIDSNPEAIALCRKRLENPGKTVSGVLAGGTCSFQTKTEEELAVLKQFECDIVQRNRGMDALLKKHYLNAPVAIKIQRADETFAAAVKLLHTAASRKKCSFMVLIARETGRGDDLNLPENMIILNRYETQFELAIEESLSRQNDSGTVSS